MSKTVVISQYHDNTELFCIIREAQIWHPLPLPQPIRCTQLTQLAIYRFFKNWDKIAVLVVEVKSELRYYISGTAEDWKLRGPIFIYSDSTSLLVLLKSIVFVNLNIRMWVLLSSIDLPRSCYLIRHFVCVSEASRAEPEYMNIHPPPPPQLAF